MNLKNRHLLGRTLLMAIALNCSLASFQLSAQKSTDDVLRSFADSYVNDAMAMTANFGIKVGSDWWTVDVKRNEEGYTVGKQNQYTFHNYGPHIVQLKKGIPSTPTWYFRVDDRSVLDKINEKIWTASTAAAKSTPADVVAFDIEDMEGYQSTQESTAIAYSIMEHFWKKDPVEITHFGRDASLPSHGAAIVSLYTMKDKRISWFTLGKEEVANGERGLDKGQVPNLFIITKGRGKAQIADEEIELEPGMSVFVGPYVKHVIYNPYDEPLEGILILYGDNIDYALGQSYMAFLEKEYEFYGKNELLTKKKN